MEYDQKVHIDGDIGGELGDYLALSPNLSSSFSSLGSSTSFSSASQRRLSTMSSMSQFGSETSLETPVPVTPDGNYGHKIFATDSLHVDIQMTDYSPGDTGPYLDLNQMTISDSEGVPTGVQSMGGLKPSSDIWEYSTSMNASDSMHVFPSNSPLLPQFPRYAACSGFKRQVECYNRSASPVLTDGPTSPLSGDPYVRSRGRFRLLTCVSRRNHLRLILAARSARLLQETLGYSPTRQIRGSQNARVKAQLEAQPHFVLVALAYPKLSQLSRLCQSRSRE